MPDLMTKCTLCGREVQTLQYINHIHVAHPEYHFSQKGKSRTCGYCTAVFSSINYGVRHMQQKHGIRSGNGTGNGTGNGMPLRVDNTVRTVSTTDPKPVLTVEPKPEPKVTPKVTPEVTPAVTSAPEYREPASVGALLDAISRLWPENQRLTKKVSELEELLALADAENRKLKVDADKWRATSENWSAKLVDLQQSLYARH
jgi:hypothetical protein